MVCRMVEPEPDGEDTRESFAVLSRDQILGALDLGIERVHVPEWGGVVCVRPLSGTERDAFETMIRGGDGHTDLRNFRARFAAMVICDESGARMFSDADVAVLGAKSSIALSRVLDAGMRLNALRDDDIDDIAGNSASVQSDASGID